MCKRRAHAWAPRGPSAPVRRPLPPAARTAARIRRWHAAVETLVALQADWAGWLAALPEATRDGATGEALPTIVAPDRDEIAASVPRRGFGRH